MKKADTIVYGFTIDGFDVEKFNTSLEIFLYVFNSSESLSATSLAGMDTYMFLTNKERNKHANAWEVELRERRLRDAEKSIQDTEHWWETNAERMKCQNGTDFEGSIEKMLENDRRNK
jgi:hypothetical protein